MTGWYRLLLLAIVSLGPLGCSTDVERQWYKPGSNYTMAEFTRDRDGCTPKGRELDEQCMKQRGWVPLTGDREPATAPKPAQGPRGPRY